MPRAKVRLNSPGVEDLLTAAGVRADLTRRMERVAEHAQSTAPVGETGNYRDSIRVEQDTTDRAVVRVRAAVPYALAVEAHTGNLARALAAAGGA